MEFWFNRRSVKSEAGNQCALRTDFVFMNRLFSHKHKKGRSEMKLDVVTNWVFRGLCVCVLFCGVVGCSEAGKEGSGEYASGKEGGADDGSGSKNEDGSGSTNEPPDTSEVAGSGSSNEEGTNKEPVKPMKDETGSATGTESGSTTSESGSTTGGSESGSTTGGGITLPQ